MVSAGRADGGVYRETGGVVAVRVVVAAALVTWRVTTDGGTSETTDLSRWWNTARSNRGLAGDSFVSRYM